MKFTFVDANVVDTYRRSVNWFRTFQWIAPSVHSLDRKKLLGSEVVADPVANAPEHLRQGLLDQWHQIVRKQQKVLVDRLVDGVAQHAVAVEQVVQLDVAATQRDVCLHFGDADVLGAVLMAYPTEVEGILGVDVVFVRMDMFREFSSGRNAEC